MASATVELIRENENRPHLSLLKTCHSGMIMGFIAFSGSFAVVPITFTITALIFGTKSPFTIYLVALSKLAAGYLHTFSSQNGIVASAKSCGGFYTATAERKNRRKFREGRRESLKRFFRSHFMNALVLSVMWETFTFCYFLQTVLYLGYVENLTNMEELECRLIIIYGITRYIAGCLAGMGTAIINHLWQRYQVPEYAQFNTNRNQLKFEWQDRKKLLSSFHIENWIKGMAMFIEAAFFILSNIPNITGLHLLDVHTKRLISDFLVIHGGWFFLRDALVLLLRDEDRPPEQSIQLDTSQTQPFVGETVEDVQLESQTRIAETT